MNSLGTASRLRRELVRCRQRRLTNSRRKRVDDTWRFIVEYHYLNAASRKYIPEHRKIRLISITMRGRVRLLLWTEITICEGRLLPSQIIRDHQVTVNFLTTNWTTRRPTSLLWTFFSSSRSCILPQPCASSILAMMGSLLHALKWPNCQCQLDNIVLSRTFSNHLQRVLASLSMFRDCGIHFTSSKCRFGHAEIAVLSHIVSPAGIHLTHAQLAP